MSEEQTIIARFAKNRGEAVVVALDEYQGHKLLSLRVYQAWEGGGDKPTKKGLSLAVARIPELREALAEAEAEAKRIGWL